MEFDESKYSITLRNSVIKYGRKHQHRSTTAELKVMSNIFEIFNLFYTATSIPFPQTYTLKRKFCFRIFKYSQLSKI